MTLDADRWYRPDPHLPAPYTRPRGAGPGELLAWFLAVVALVVGGWFAFVGHPVDATVTAVPEDSICSVRWDGRDGRVERADVDCLAGEGVGDVMRAQALGAPFEGDALDLAITPYALGVLVGGLLALALGLSWRRRRAGARLASAGATTSGPVAGSWGAVEPIGVAPGTVSGAGGGAWAAGGARPADVRPDLPDVVDPQDDLDAVDVYVAVRVPHGSAVDPAVLVEALRPTGFVGAVVDGARVDAPGWLLATTTGFGDGTVLRWVDGDSGLRADLRWETVRAALVPVFGPDVHVGRHVVLDGRPFPSPAGLASVPAVDSAWPLPASQVAVGRWPLPELAVVARGVGEPVHAALVDGVVLLQHADPTVPPRLLFAAAYETSSPRVLLWSVGAQHGFLVFHRGEPVASHAWGVRWHLVDPDPSPRPRPDREPSGSEDHGDAQERYRPVDAVLDEYRDVNHGGAHLAGLFGVEDPVRVRDLERLLAEDTPASAVPRLLAALGLPAVAGEVLAGRRRVADLPGARLEVPVGFVRAVMRSLTAGDWSPGRSEAARRRWYEWPESVNPWVRAGLVVFLTTFNAILRFSEGDTARAWLAIGGGLVVLVLDTLIERRRRRRIARAAREGSTTAVLG